ncbi:TIGR03086 family metal-binding protein [Kineococcus sp. NPDC059986]|uniref:TIGR03086 family metal-binding protein n=1 Tax=Kineococcus sp. NPDC059986 TaxID=3155538 RepID=UPI00344EABC6
MTSAETPTQTTADTRAQTTAEDPRQTMFLAADLAGRVLDAVPDGAHPDPTPCTEWTVDDLRGHLVAVTARVAHIARGGYPFDLPTLLEEEPAGGFAAAYAAGVAGVRAAWADDAVLTATVHHPAGDMPGAAGATVYAQEFATHAVDLAVATGRTDLLDEGFLARVLEIARRVVPAQREGFPFAPPVAVPDDAPAHVQLSGWLGRVPA